MTPLDRAADGPAFTGFPEDVLEFWEGLAADNTRTYWQAHREQYQRTVAEPTAALAEALRPEFGPVKVFRPYRDVRFSNDKRAYKEMTSLVTTGQDELLYLQLGLDGLLLAGGRYQPGIVTLTAFRRAVSEPRVAASYDRTVDELAGHGLVVDGGELLRTVPRGWPKDHPRLDLLRMRSLVLARHEPPQEWMHTPRLLDETVATWRRLRTWNDWLSKHVPAG